MMALRPSLGWGAGQGGAPGYGRLRRLRAAKGGGDLVGGSGVQERQNLNLGWSASFGIPPFLRLPLAAFCRQLTS